MFRENIDAAGRRYSRRKTYRVVLLIEATESVVYIVENLISNYVHDREIHRRIYRASTLPVAQHT